MWSIPPPAGNTRRRLWRNFPDGCGSIWTRAFPGCLRRRTARYWLCLRRSLRRTPGLRLGRRGHSIPVCRRTPEARRHRAVHRIAGSAARRGYVNCFALITHPNPASAAFHERMGFAEAARLPHAGYKDGRWLGLSYYQLTLQPLPAVPVPPVPLSAGRRRNGTITATRQPVPSRAGGALNGI
ncbi:MAG: N-acetyltransferase family protein [Ruthenibacterium lactatiformans]